jgi:GAF domain-containing protein
VVTSPAPLPDLVLAPDLAATRRSLQPVLDLATSIAASSLPGAAGAGISLIEDGARVSTASTNALVSLADERQYELGEGPCLTAWATTTLVRIDDLDRDERWPHWAEAARALHLRSVLSTAVIGTARNLGAIKVYSERPHAFDRAAEDLLLRLADQSAILLENLQTLTDAERSSAAVMAALEARQEVVLAQGVLMGRQGLSRQQAFLQLSQDAARHGRTVAEEAAELVTGT